VNVSLRPVVAADLKAFYEQQADPESVRLAAVAARDRAAHFPHWEKALADENTLVRTIDVDGENAGHIVSFLRDGVGDREVGYWLARSYWGRGVATEALTQFLELDPRRPLIAHVATHNPGSRRVLEKCGFTVEREVENAQGDGVDEVHLRLE
jgi:RimJ/RimL family protein N-acetyltransferase